MAAFSVADSLAKWRRKETYRRAKWKAAKPGTPARALWYRRLKHAKAMVAKREQQVAKLQVTSVSKAGLRLVEMFEGFRARPYRDAVGVLTIGFGETQGVKPWMVWTRGYAERRLRQRIDRDYLAPVLRYCHAVGFKPSQHEADALASFAYNLGPGVFNGTSSMGKAIAGGNRDVVARAFLLYDMAGGHELAGLTRRRQLERHLFLTGVA